MVILDMERFGPVIDAWEVARFDMVVSTSQQTGFSRLNAVETFKPATKSASGVTGLVVTEQ